MDNFTNSLERLNFDMEEIKLFDSFAGIGALHQALKELGVPVRLVGMSEIDIDAIISYGAVHGYLDVNNYTTNETEENMRKYLIERNIGINFKTGKSKIPRLNKDKLKKCYEVCIKCNNYGDISTLKEDIIDFDLFNMSFPCTDVSIAGKQKGFVDEGGNLTRSGLYVEGIKVIKNKRPKYIMIENVKNLISKKFIKNFYEMVKEIESFGYKCYYPMDKNNKPHCLNAKDYGIPQNRERIFVICIRKDIDNNNFSFPSKIESCYRLGDILEDNPANDYYLSEDEINKVLNWKAYQRPFKKVLRLNSICSTLTARGAGEYHSGMVLFSEELKGITNCEKLFATADYRYDEGLRIRKELISPCVTTNSGTSLSGTPLFLLQKLEELKIRRITPKESWRLMGFRDECFNRSIDVGITNSQLYKQAGNSIVVNVLYYIFKELFRDYIAK